MTDIDAPFNPNIIESLLRERGISKQDLANRLDKTVADLEQDISGETDPPQPLLNDIAAELRVPSFVFYMNEAPTLEDVLPDYRSNNPKITGKSRETIKAIQVAKGVQDIVIRHRPVSSAYLPEVNLANIQDIEHEASITRKFFGIKINAQRTAKDAQSFYLYCRKKIEDHGIFVLHESFPTSDGSGFCIYHNEYPVIVVNTRQQTIERRLFTLIHELAHVLIGKSGISDPFIRNNKIERRCNEFAGSFLLPRSSISTLLQGVAVPRSPSTDDVARISRRLKVSQQAAILRLETLGYVAQGSHEEWLNKVSKAGNPDFSPKRGGAGGPPNQGQVKLSYYGFRFADAFERLVRSKQVSPLNVYRATGLKPKYQSEYFDFAKSVDISPADEAGSADG